MLQRVRGIDDIATPLQPVDDLVDEAGSKLAKAQSLGVTIIDEAELRTLLGAAE